MTTGPCGKEKLTQLDAKLAVFKSQSSKNPKREERRSYHCGWCDAYHTTKMEQMEKGES